MSIWKPVNSPPPLPRESLPQLLDCGRSLGTSQCPPDPPGRSLLKRLCTPLNAEGKRVPLVDVGLLSSPQFNLLAMGCFLGMTGFYLTMLTPAHARSLDIGKEEVAVLLSATGIADTSGRLLVGFVSESPFVKHRRVEFMCLYLVICGVGCGASVIFAKTFVSQLVFLVVFVFSTEHI